MVRIVTDSTSDITQAEARALGVTVVPLTVHLCGASYRDGIDLSVEDFFDKMEASGEVPTTSQVPPGEFTHLFQSLVDAGDEVVGIFISSEMSGTYQSAQVARELVDAERIHVVDSRVATFELALLVREAVRMKDAGKTAVEIAEAVRLLTKRVRLFAVIDTLKYLRLSGRISTATAFVGGLLGINPLISVRDGKVVSTGKSRGLKAGLSMIAEQMRADPPDLDYRVSFGHINAPAFLKETVSFLAGEFGIEEYFEANIGITVGTHVGPGAAGIAYIAKE